MQLDYTIPTDKPFADAVQAVVDAALAHKFSVPFVNTLSETLAEKGFPREPVTIIRDVQCAPRKVQCLSAT